MFIDRLQPITDAFDWVQHSWERAATQRRVAFFILWVYLLALLGVELNRHGILPPWLATVSPRNHFYAIHLAFTLILVLEVMGLILVIPSSLSQSMGKQFEILTLILLRNAFKELAHLPPPDPRPTSQNADNQVQEEKRKQLLKVLAEIEKRVND